MALCLVWGLFWLVLLSNDGRSGLTEFASLVVFALSCPCGLITGALTTMDGSGSGSVVSYLALSGANCFLLGYGLTGSWRFFRRLLSPTFP